MNLQAGTIICYENQGKLLLGIVNESQAKKVLVLNESNQQTALSFDRIHCLPQIDKTIRVDDLKKLKTEAEDLANSINPAELWEMIGEYDKFYSNSDLAELFFSKNSNLEHLAIRIALLKNSTYFKRETDGFSTRNTLAVEQLLAQEASINEQKETEQQLVDFFNGQSKELNHQAKELVLRLKEFAAGSEELSEHQLRQVRDLLRNISNSRNPFPEQAYELLKKCGEFNDLTNLPFYRYRVRRNFSIEALNQAKTLQAKDTTPRIDLRSLHTITIDDDSTLDMDDALSITRNPEGYDLGIHISDVASLIDSDSLLDQESLQRATSIYLADTVLNMLPEVISEDSASLVAGKERLAISCLVKLNHNFEILNFQIVASTIVVKERLSYEQADLLLEQGDEFLNNLYQAATAFEQYRWEQGGSSSARKSAKIRVTNEQLELTIYDETSPSRRLVGELMVMANYYFAKLLIDSNIPAISRTQSPPDEVENNDNNEKKPLLKPSKTTLSPGRHYSLGLEHYFQATSLIRRYVDLVHQRQIHCALDKIDPIYKKPNLKQLLQELDEPLRKALALTRASDRFWVLKYLERRQGQTFNGIVLKHEPKRNALIELEDLHLNLFIKLKEQTKPGTKLKLILKSVSAIRDDLHLAVV